MEPQNFTPQDSLKLIQSMLEKTRADMGDNAGHFLLWGWITFIACTGQFILLKSGYEKHYLVWLLIIPGVIISTYMGIRDSKKQKAKSYIGESMNYLWMGMGISFFVLIMILNRLGSNSSGFPFFMLLYGLGTFISGKFLQFKPLVYGGVAAWLLAIVSGYFNYEYQILFAAGAILVSYIIPAYMLRSKKHQSPNS
jgi:hypothetical protein